jgi:soluble lytic murein transglycosylase-like protein
MDKIVSNKYKKTFILYTIFVSLSLNGFALDINMKAIEWIESRGNPKAYNKKSGAIGLYQIKKICLDDYNQLHQVKYKREDLYNPLINKKIAKWYLYERIPQLLRYYNCPVTLESVILSYRWGTKNFKDGNYPHKKYLRAYEDYQKD